MKYKIRFEGVVELEELKSIPPESELPEIIFCDKFFQDEYPVFNIRGSLDRTLSSDGMAQRLIVDTGL